MATLVIPLHLLAAIEDFAREQMVYFGCLGSTLRPNNWSGSGATAKKTQIIIIFLGVIIEIQSKCVSTSEPAPPAYRSDTTCHIDMTFLSFISPY